MYYVYVLISLRDKKTYIGSTADLKNRFVAHQGGGVKSTKNRRPLEVLFYEAYLTKEIARNREKYLKSSDGHKDIKKRNVL